MSDNYFLPSSLKQGELTQDEKEMRDVFVREYIKDGDPYAACLRIGFSSSWAHEYAEKFMHETYVRQQITEAQSNVNYTDKNIAESLKRMLFGMMWKFSQVGATPAQVSAASKLMNILGMDAPTKTEVLHKGGVMVIPEVKTMEQWEAATIREQQKLIEDARSPN